MYGNIGAGEKETVDERLFADQDIVLPDWITVVEDGKKMIELTMKWNIYIYIEMYKWVTLPCISSEGLWSSCWNIIKLLNEK